MSPDLQKTLLDLLITGFSFLASALLGIVLKKLSSLEKAHAEAQKENSVLREKLGYLEGRMVGQPGDRRKLAREPDPQ